MDIVMLVLNILVLMLMSATLGYFIGKGKVVIAKKLTDKEKELIEKMEREQDEAIEKYNATMKAMTDYSGGTNIVD